MMEVIVVSVMTMVKIRMMTRMVRIVVTMMTSCKHQYYNIVNETHRIIIIIIIIITTMHLSTRRTRRRTKRR